MIADGHLLGVDKDATGSLPGRGNCAASDCSITPARCGPLPANSMLPSNGYTCCRHRLTSPAAQMIPQTSGFPQDRAVSVRVARVDTGPPGADNTNAMHAWTARQTHTAAAPQWGDLSVVAAVAPVSLPSLMVVPVVVSPVVSITGIVIICPAGGVLG